VKNDSVKGVPVISLTPEYAGISKFNICWKTFNTGLYNASRQQETWRKNAFRSGPHIILIALSTLLYTFYPADFDLVWISPES